jgi:hypothetical protein
MRTVCLLCLAAATLAGPPQVQRLKPGAFPDLPEAVTSDLVRRRCEVPQPYSAKAPAGIIRGRFTVATQMDVAVLCSVAGQSKILVYRNGSTSDVAELAPRRDDDFLQGVGDGAVGYSRAIGVASPAYIQGHHRAYGGPPLPSPLDHDGINDIFVEKASEVLYWHGGKWLKLQGADDSMVESSSSRIPEC